MTRELREYFGISQDEMARQLGISRSHLAMIESGKRELNSEKHARLGKLFLAINGIKDTAISSEKAILPDHAGEERFFGCVKLELLTYRNRLLKINRQICTLQTSRERKAKRFMRIGMLEHAGEKGSESVNIRTHGRPPSL
ncbi:MAG TPA: helix-turn-helix transcriptional regulator, partial [Ferruginibacter sp.]|nr:helix-turn-helix transcriptional regulator [Ferruginibacter sp.]